MRVLVVLCSSFLKGWISEFRVAVVTEEEGKMYKKCEAGVAVFIIKLFFFHVAFFPGSQNYNHDDTGCEQSLKPRKIQYILYVCGRMTNFITWLSTQLPEF